MSVIFGTRQDCPRSLASFQVRVVREKMALCRKCPRDCASCREPRQKQNHATRLDRKPFIMYSSLGRKQEIADTLGDSQILRTVSAGSETWRTSLFPVGCRPGITESVHHSFPQLRSYLLFRWMDTLRKDNC